MELIKPQNLTLTAEQLASLLPYLILLVGTMIALLVGVSSIGRRREGKTEKGFNNAAVAGLAMLTLGATGYAIAAIWGEPSITLFNGMLAVDYYTGLFNLVFIGATALVTLASYSYLEKEKIHHPEYYCLMLLACLGMMFLAAALDLIVLFIALEVMSIAVYVLVGFRRTDIRSNEAAVKYFILGSAASAILLYGAAMLYGATGTMNIVEITALIKTTPITSNSLFVLGAVLVIAGFLFKVAAVPFHMWMPDVYEGAPTTVTSFMTTGLKAAAFAAFLRIFIGFGYAEDFSRAFSQHFRIVLVVIALLTMFIGNVVALTQDNIKRMLAYSSIAHTGYILVGVLSSGRSEYAMSSVILYLITYVIMNIGAFTVVGLLSEKGDAKTDVKDLAGLGFKKPLLGFAMSVFMFSMAGIPPTAGFAGKYLIFSSAVQAGEVKLAILSVLCSAISAYYYLRVIVYMYMREPVREFSKSKIAIPVGLVLILVTLATLHFGLFPNVLIHAAKKAVLNI